MRSVEFLKEEIKSTAVMTWGRFNPPTKGHQKLILKTTEMALALKADEFVFVSQTHDAEKNPLDYDKKIYFLRRFFPRINIVKNRSIRTIFNALEYLVDRGYSRVYLLVGSDRVNQFKEAITPYIEKDSAYPDLSIKFFKVVSAGYRDPDVAGVEGMSASKARGLVADGKESDFIQYAAPDSKSTMLKKELYDATRKGMNL